MEVVRRREDRVRRIPAVPLTVAVAVHAVGGPRRREELHRPAGTGGVDGALPRARGIGVAPVVALDLADAGQHRPVEAVASAAAW